MPQDPTEHPDRDDRDQALRRRFWIAYLAGMATFITALIAGVRWLLS